MSQPPDNPFDRHELDPTLGPEAITERLRELVVDAPPEEREALRAAWEQLTLSPKTRVRLALSAHPESRPPLRAPTAPPSLAAFAPKGAAKGAWLELADLVCLPRVAAALSPVSDEPREPSSGLEHDDALDPE